MKRILSLVLTLVFLLSLALVAGCGSTPQDAEKNAGKTETKKLVVGAIGEPHTKMLNMVKPKLAEQGIDMQIKDFTDYAQLNPALNDGQIEANFFQHIPYLEDYNKKTGSDLVWTVKTHTEPMRIYSKKIDSLDKLAEGATVGIPNDRSNSGRALMLLEAAGLIKLKPEAGVTATERDIVENNKKLEIKMSDAAMLPRALEDLDICCINTNFALDAGLDPVKEAIFVEPGDSPFANVVVVRPEDRDKDTIKALGAALQSPEIGKFLKDNYPSCVLAF